MFRRIKGSEFLRNVFTLFSGTALAQAVPFMILPILQRFFYTPADFGLLAIYISFTGIFATAATLKYEYAIVLAKTNKEASGFFFIAVSSGVAIGLLILLAVIVAGESIADLLGSKSIYPFLFLAPFSIISYSFFQSLSYWLNREKRFGKIAGGKLTQTTAAESVKVASGFMRAGAIGLIGGRLAGEIIGTLFYMAALLNKKYERIEFQSTGDLKELIKKYKEYPLFTMPSAFIGTLSSVIYIFLFSNFYSAEIVGYAGIATTYIAVPIGLISASVSQVFLNKISGIILKEELRKIYMNYMLVLFGISFIVIVVIYLIPVSWVVILLGEEWAPLMIFIRVFVLWIAVSFVSSSLSFIYIKLKKQKEMFIADIIHLVLVIGSIVVSHNIYQDVYITIWFFTGAQIIYYIFAILLAFVFLKKPGSI